MKIINLFILDNSGSMSGIKDTIIKGFNDQIDAIKKLDKDNGTESLFGFTTFDSNVKVQYLNEHMDMVTPLSAANYRPDGYTAFYDALGVSIKALEDKLGSRARVR